MLTAAFALPLLILLIVKGGVVLFTGVILLISFLGLLEFYRMALPERGLAGMAASLAGGLLPLSFLYQQQFPLLLVLSLIVILAGNFFLFSITDIKKSATENAVILMGFLYVPLLLGHIILLRVAPHGIKWIFLLLFIVMLGDTGAYFVGCSLGRRKLYPLVSPNKSMEGALGGLVGSIGGALLVKYTFFSELTLFDALASAILLGILGQLGDLFESLLKRSFGVKDSGAIIPGHGGILDRLDSILFAVPAAYYYAVYVFMGR